MGFFCASTKNRRGVPLNLLPHLSRIHGRGSPASGTDLCGWPFPLVVLSPRTLHFHMSVAVSHTCWNVARGPCTFLPIRSQCLCIEFQLGSDTVKHNIDLQCGAA